MNIPFRKKYNFNNEPLEENFPEYFRAPIAAWIKIILERNNQLADNGFGQYIGIKYNFGNILNLKFRECFPADWHQFLSFVFSDTNRSCEIISFLLTDYSDINSAAMLEHILSEGGSAYAVKINGNSFNLVTRVSPIVVKASGNSLSKNELLMEAWNNCYSRKPDYGKVVSQCNDFMEGYLRDKYWHEEAKTKSISVCVKEFIKNPSMLSFRGDKFIKDKKMLIELLDGISKIRGEHTTGQGRKPESEEAEYVLHTTIYFWNLHER